MTEPAPETIVRSILELDVSELLIVREWSDYKSKERQC